MSVPLIDLSASEPVTAGEQPIEMYKRTTVAA
jgi:hypothetical protein